MSYRINFERMDLLIKEMQSKYRFFAPVSTGVYGWNSEIDTIRYAEISSVSDIVHDIKSDFSPKEVLYPIIQRMSYFYENTYRESDPDEKDMILFARPCDINGIRRLDTILLKNGELEDIYYKRVRDKVKIIMLECLEGWDDCFCVSMNSNIAEDYDAAIKIKTDHVLLSIKDNDLDKYFHDEEQCDFVPGFIGKNSIQISVPIINSENLMRVFGMGLWDSSAENCLSCGKCTAVCISCSCYDTKSIVRDESNHIGERQKVWSSCMDKSFTLMASGHSVRKNAGERLRFRTLHKIYDYKSRFGQEHMCVGCGRCISICPEDISMTDIMNSINDALEESAGNQEEASDR